MLRIHSDFFLLQYDPRLHNTKTEPCARKFKRRDLRTSTGNTPLKEFLIATGGLVGGLALSDMTTSSSNLQPPRFSKSLLAGSIYTHTGSSRFMLIPSKYYMDSLYTISKKFM